MTVWAIPGSYAEGLSGGRVSRAGCRSPPMVAGVSHVQQHGFPRTRLRLPDEPRSATHKHGGPHRHTDRRPVHGSPPLPHPRRRHRPSHLRVPTMQRGRNVPDRLGTHRPHWLLHRMPGMFTGRPPYRRLARYDVTGRVHHVPHAGLYPGGDTRHDGRLRPFTDKFNPLAFARSGTRPTTMDSRDAPAPGSRCIRPCPKGFCVRRIPERRRGRVQPVCRGF